MAGGRERPACAACGFAHFGTYFVATGGGVVDGDRILLARKATPPSVGLWTLPGGFVEEDELLEQGVVREVAEETGIHAGNPRLVAVRSVVGARGHDTYLVFRLDLLGGDLRPDGVEIGEVAWFDRERLQTDSDVAAYSVLVALACLDHGHAGLARRPYARVTGEPADFFVVAPEG
jgi:ADP-ribose pyrophosphatase YjhB (NUDIX family)